VAQGTKIKAPRVGGRPISGTASGVIGGGAGGAAAGALAGAAIGAAGGPIGVVGGAIIGAAYGVVSGALGGAEADKSAYYKKVASKWAKMGQERQAALERNNYIREFRARRAMTMMGYGEEGANRSSAPQGAADSLKAQFAFGQAYSEGQHFIQRQYSKNMNKAGKAAQAAQTIFSTQAAVFQAAQTIGSLYPGPSAAGSAGTPGVGTTSPSSGGLSNPYSPGWSSSASSSYTSSFSPPSR
jgi:phage tail tape-measure protein